MSKDAEKDAVEAVHRMLESVENGDSRVNYHDAHDIAYYVWSMADRDTSEMARWLGARGGKKGGKARAEKLSPERRSEIARKAANARWGNEEA